MMGSLHIAPSRRRQLTVSRAVLLVSTVVWGLVVTYIVFGVSGWVAATPATVQAAAPAGTASVSGTVTSTAPFKAAQVSLRNVDKRILYMVYTNAGQFRALALFPGNYEVSVATKGLVSDTQKVVLKAGDNPAVKLSLRPGGDATGGPLEQSYDEIYPPGPGRDVAERTCIACHGENFLPSRPATLAGWTARVDFMQGKTLFDRPAGAYAEGLLTFRNSALRFSRQDREDLLAYMVKNFGPDAKPRTVRIEQEMPFDEAKLAKAMYIEYT